MAQAVVVIVALIAAGGTIVAGYFAGRRSGSNVEDPPPERPTLGRLGCPYMVEVGAEYLLCDQKPHHDPPHQRAYGEALIVWDGDLPTTFRRVIAPL